jgi:hypothetical protein
LHERHKEGEPVIQELTRSTAMAHMVQEEHLEDPSAFFRGLLLAIAVSVPVWGALILALTKIGSS